MYYLQYLSYLSISGISRKKMYTKNEYVFYKLCIYKTEYKCLEHYTYNVIRNIFEAK